MTGFVSLAVRRVGQFNCILRGNCRLLQPICGYPRTSFLSSLISRPLVTPSRYMAPRTTQFLLPYSTIPPEPHQPSPPSSSPTDPPSTEKLGITQRLKAFFRRYGKLGIFVYISISVGTFSSIYLALRSGVDVRALMDRLGVPQKGILKDAGTLAIAYAIYKILLPLRLFAAVGITSWMAKRTSIGRKLTNMNGNKPPGA